MSKEVNTSNLINFKDIFQLLKNYLSKVDFSLCQKRFNYVYEEALKCYNKNNALLANHQILQLCQIIFFVLQKKIKSKITPKIKNLNNAVFKELHTNMINIYLSWQKLIAIQLSGQDPQFFNMLHRQNKDQNYLIALSIKSLQISNKPDFIISHKIDLQFNLYSFLKQTLRMLINTLLNFVFNQFFNLELLASLIIKGQHILSKFQDSFFFIEKTQFQIIKYQILQSLTQNLKQKVVQRGVSLKYNFPIKLVTQITKGIFIWDDSKINYYVKLLCKFSFMCIKNSSMTLMQMYILSNQLKKIFELIKNQNQNEPLARSGRIQKNLHFQFNRELLESKNQKNEDKTNIDKKRNRTKTKDSMNQNKLMKKRLQSAIKSIIQIIQYYIAGRNQIQHILKLYISDLHEKYSKLEESDQIIAEPVVLNIKQTLKVKKMPDKAQSLASKIAIPNKKRHILSLLKKQSIIQDENNQNSANNSKTIKKASKQFILKNINLVKKQNKLILNTIGNNKNRKISKMIVQQRITKKLLNALPSLNLETNLVLNQEEESDDDNQMVFEFQQKRRDNILRLNNKLYKNNNHNYLIKSRNSQNIALQFENDFLNFSQQNKQNNEESNQKEEFAFEEIKLLDQVVCEKIQKYLNIKIKQKLSQFYINPKESNKNKGEIMQIKQATQNMVKLKFQVDQMNKQHLLVIDKFNYQKNLIKTAQKYNSGYSNQEEIYHNGQFKQIDNIINFKNNLTQKAKNCISLYKNLMNLERIERSEFFDQIICKYKGYQIKNNQQAQNQIQNQQILQQIKVIQYLVENRPRQQWQINKEKKEHLKIIGGKETQKNHDIALRETFDTLRRNVGKIQFNQNYVANKNLNFNSQTLKTDQIY